MNLRRAGAALVIVLAGCSASHPANPIGVLPNAPSATLVSRGGSSGVQDLPALSGSWTTKASMPTARSQLAVGVVNGVVYAIGGQRYRNYLGTVEAFTPFTP